MTSFSIGMLFVVCMLTLFVLQMAYYGGVMCIQRICVQVDRDVATFKSHKPDAFSWANVSASSSMAIAVTRPRITTIPYKTAKV